MAHTNGFVIKGVHDNFSYSEVLFCTHKVCSFMGAKSFRKEKEYLIQHNGNAKCPDYKPLISAI